MSPDILSYRVVRFVLLFYLTEQHNCRMSLKRDVKFFSTAPHESKLPSLDRAHPALLHLIEKRNALDKEQNIMGLTNRETDETFRDDANSSDPNPTPRQPKLFAKSAIDSSVHSNDNGNSNVPPQSPGMGITNSFDHNYCDKKFLINMIYPNIEKLELEINDKKIEINVREFMINLYENLRQSLFLWNSEKPLLLDCKYNSFDHSQVISNITNNGYLYVAVICKGFEQHKVFCDELYKLLVKFKDNLEYLKIFTIDGTKPPEQLYPTFDLTHIDINNCETPEMICNYLIEYMKSGSILLNLKKRSENDAEKIAATFEDLSLISLFQNHTLAPSLCSLIEFLRFCKDYKTINLICRDLATLLFYINSLDQLATLKDDDNTSSNFRSKLSDKELNSLNTGLSKIQLSLNSLGNYLFSISKTTFDSTSYTSKVNNSIFLGNKLRAILEHRIGRQSGSNGIDIDNSIFVIRFLLENIDEKLTVTYNSANVNFIINTIHNKDRSLKRVLKILISVSDDHNQCTIDSMHKYMKREIPTVDNVEKMKSLVTFLKATYAHNQEGYYPLYTKDSKQRVSL